MIAHENTLKHALIWTHKKSDAKKKTRSWYTGNKVVKMAYLNFFTFTPSSKNVQNPEHLCDNYVPQWWVEFDDELSCLFTNSLGANIYNSLN